MRIHTLACTAALLCLSVAAQAALKAGDAAPGFKTPAAVAGKAFDFDMAEALKKGPVVLYFFPKAFTQGCTLEAHAFAEAHDKFAAAGATVIGMSADDLPTLQRFSTEACRDKFAVAVASPAVIAAYDVALKMDRLPAQARGKMPSGLTDRTSYVIARNGKIAFVHSDLDYREHVNLSLAAVKALGKK